MWSGIWLCVAVTELKRAVFLVCVMPFTRAVRGIVGILLISSECGTSG